MALDLSDENVVRAINAAYTRLETLLKLHSAVEVKIKPLEDERDTLETEMMRLGKRLELMEEIRENPETKAKYEALALVHAPDQRRFSFSGDGEPLSLLKDDAT